MNGNYNNYLLGNQAGSKKNDGYLRVKINYKEYRLHRIIYKMFYNEEPNYIDHINGIRDDNRPENLRSVTKSENSRNISKSIRNTSGVVGVNFRQNTNKWRAVIYTDNKHKHLGYFVKFEDAVLARKEAEIEYGYHENHGR